MSSATVSAPPRTFAAIIATGGMRRARTMPALLLLCSSLRRLFELRQPLGMQPFQLRVVQQIVHIHLDAASVGSSSRLTGQQLLQEGVDGSGRGRVAIAAGANPLAPDLPLTF